MGGEVLDADVLPAGAGLRPELVDSHTVRGQRRGAVEHLLMEYVQLFQGVWRLQERHDPRWCERAELRLGGRIESGQVNVDLFTAIHSDETPVDVRVPAGPGLTDRVRQAGEPGGQVHRRIRRRRALR